MRNKKYVTYIKFFLVVIIIGFLSYGFKGRDKNGNSTSRIYKTNSTTASGKVGDSYRMDINNLNIPINNVGTIADVNIPPDGTLGRFGNSTFLFSSGFMMSGYTNGNLWAFAQATASLVENMTKGTVASGQNDPDAQMYVLKRDDPPFGESWQDWKTAVDKFGADFYDGDGDGEYNPVDVNGNGEWDADEDRPDLLGDETAWCVYNDGVTGAQRTRFTGINPQGVEIRQTVFAFASKGALGNIMFIRYRIRNTGLVADELDSVYFSVWADPDLGAEYEDDLVGVDVSRNAGFTYNGDDEDVGGYGTQVPCFMIDFFSGPAAFIPGETFTDNDGDGVYTDGVDSPLDTAYSYRGQVIGVKEIVGAKNLPISSFVHYQQSDPTRGDPDNEFEARNYMLGKLKLGEDIDPCNDPVGEVNGIDCSTVDTKFWYSGDPVSGIGWLNNSPTDQRQLTNVGPFTLNVGEDKEIIVAYVVGQGSNRFNSITVARKIDDGAQFIFNGNFRAPNPPPSLDVTVESGENFIDFLFPVIDQVPYTDKTDAWDNRFQGINVYAYKTNSTQETISGVQNAKVYTSYQLDNFIKNVYKVNAETGGKELLYPESATKLDYQVYTDPEKGRVRLRLTKDPFTGDDLIKGKPYYFAFTSYALNYVALEPMDENSSFGDDGDYYLSAEGFVAEIENVPRIISTVLGEDLYNPPVKIGDGSQIAGGSRGQLTYDVVSKNELTGQKYKVTFYPDSSTEIYSSFWKLENTTTNTLLLDSAKFYLYNDPDISLIPTQGFIVKLSEEVPGIDSTLNFEYAGDPWINETGSSLHYLTPDIEQSAKLRPIGGNLNNLNGSFVKADRLRRVEIRFGETQKAYRYLNGYVGANQSQRQRFFKYAESVTTDLAQDDQVLLNGEWDATNGRAIGYVDVPFQVWVEDENFGEMRQLAVAFIEKSTAFGGNPDGKWDPGTVLFDSGEYILIFDSPYDPNGNQNIYKGGPYIDPDAGYADLNGAGISNGAFYRIPPEASISETDRKISESSFFNTLYAVGIQKIDKDATYTTGDKIIIEVENYPYTDEDVYEFETRLAGALTDNEEKALFDRVNVFPNPLYGYNVATSYDNSSADEPFVTFSNLPEEVTIKIYSLSGQLLRTLQSADKSAPTSPFLRWDLQNDSGLRVASGMYIALVSSPKYGEKVLKFAIVMPQKQIQKY